MSADDLYQIWRRNAIEKARQAVRIANSSFAALEEKGSVYGRSIEAMRDMHLQALAVYESSPEQLREKP